MFFAALSAALEGLDVFSVLDEGLDPFSPPDEGLLVSDLSFIALCGLSVLSAWLEALEGLEDFFVDEGLDV